MGRRRAAARKGQFEARSGIVPPRGAAAEVTDPVEILVVRARKLRQKGDLRRALVTLREACKLDEWRARTWTLLGAELARLGQRADAVQAFEQARWLRARAGDKARAAVTAELAARLVEAA